MVACISRSVDSTPSNTAVLGCFSLPLSLQLLPTPTSSYPPLSVSCLLCSPSRDLNPNCIPVSESLQDTMERTLPLLVQKILPDIKAGKTVLVVAHANSLRGEATMLPLASLSSSSS